MLQKYRKCERLLSSMLRLKFFTLFEPGLPSLWKEIRTSSIGCELQRVSEERLHRGSMKLIHHLNHSFSFPLVMQKDGKKYHDYCVSCEHFQNTSSTTDTLCFSPANKRRSADKVCNRMRDNLRSNKRVLNLQPTLETLNLLLAMESDNWMGT